MNSGDQLDYKQVSDELFEQAALQNFDSDAFRQHVEDNTKNNSYTRKFATKAEIQEMIDKWEGSPSVASGGDTDKNSHMFNAAGISPVRNLSGKQLRAVKMIRNREKTLNNPVRGDAAYVPMDEV